jgi:hypothetical protein
MVRSVSLPLRLWYPEDSANTVSLELSSRLDADTGGLLLVCSPQLLAGMLGIWFCVRAQRAVVAYSRSYRRRRISIGGRSEK